MKWIFTISCHLECGRLGFHGFDFGKKLARAKYHSLSSLAHTLRFQWKAAESGEICEMVLKVLSSEMDLAEIRFLQ